LYCVRGGKQHSFDFFHVPSLSHDLLLKPDVLSPNLVVDLSSLKVHVPVA
jgi:hypothetical protein